MTDSVPKVSVVITCHNLGRYLQEALDSVHRQSLQDYEIIVVDDASSEGETVEILKRIDAPRVRLIRVEKRSVSAARNSGIRESRGGYICCLDADDMLRTTFLEKTTAILDGEPDVGFAGCWCETFGEEKIVVRHGTFPTLVDFLGENHAPTSSLFRREAWEKAGGYEERLMGYEDWELWINLMTHGYRCAIVQESSIGSGGIPRYIRPSAPRIAKNSWRS
ncbi:MAG: glycosyltransferase family A protein [bacterium]